MNDEKHFMGPGKYIINEKRVSREEFEEFLESLEQIPGTWFCDDDPNGGATGYGARDKDGNVYRYCIDSDPNNTITSITKSK